MTKPLIEDLDEILRRAGVTPRFPSVCEACGCGQVQEREAGTFKAVQHTKTMAEPQRPEMKPVHPDTKRLEKPKYPKPTTKVPSLKTLRRWTYDGIAQATDGCEVEPDGVCPHGHPSWLMKLGYV